MATRRRWTPEAIQAEPAPIVAELGRIPTGEELAARGIPGLSSAMQRDGGDPVAHGLDAGRELSEAVRR
jgi:hypothetical protein